MSAKHVFGLAEVGRESEPTFRCSHLGKVISGADDRSPVQETIADMLIVHVHARVKPESIEAFRRAAIENARQSVRESGVARFDVLQDSSEPSRFLLVEVYRTAEAPAQHKATAHYATWRDTVADMMAEPRTSVKYENVFPGDEGW